VLIKVLLGGIIVTLPLLALAFAVSSTTTRRGEASAGIIFVLSIAWLVPENLVKIAGVHGNVLLLDILQLPLEIVSRMYKDDREISLLWRREIGSSALLVAAYLAWTIGFAAFAFYRYRRIQVTR
jgi:hypothetical protein